MTRFGQLLPVANVRFRAAERRGTIERWRERTKCGWDALSRGHSVAAVPLPSLLRVFRGTHAGLLFRFAIRMVDEGTRVVRRCRPASGRWRGRYPLLPKLRLGVDSKSAPGCCLAARHCIAAVAGQERSVTADRFCGTKSIVSRLEVGL